MSADTIITNGRLYTVDPQRRWAQALAIKDGVIVAVCRVAVNDRTPDERNQWFRVAVKSGLSR